MEITIGNKKYKVKQAVTEQEQEEGLQNIEELPEDEGMLFVFDPPQEVSMWMKDTLIPLDIIFINEDREVTKVHKGEPNDTTLITQDNTAYVLEVNQDSGIKVGDSLELDKDSDSPVMKVLAQDGTSQMDLWGGERIFSRKNTVILIKKAKKAEITNDDNDYKALGRYMFKCIKQQDERQPEYVEAPKDKETSTENN